MGDVDPASAVNDWTGYSCGYRLRTNRDGEGRWPQSIRSTIVNDYNETNTS